MPITVRPRLLVSVRSGREAAIAVQAGADLIDVKEPRHGPLGRAAVEVWREVRQAVAGQRPVSVALGELLEDSGHWAAADTNGFCYAKIGLAGCAEHPAWRLSLQRVSSRLAPGTRSVSVIYADWRRARAPAPCEIVEHAAQSGCETILIDTFAKDQGDLFQQLGWKELAGLCAEIHQRKLTLVLAGSLSLQTLPRAVCLQPAVVALRGAVCQGSRDGDVDAQRVSEWVAQLARCA